MSEVSLARYAVFNDWVQDAHIVNLQFSDGTVKEIPISHEVVANEGRAAIVRAIYRALKKDASDPDRGQALWRAACESGLLAA